MATSPTILLGLGGVGSTIVERVYGRIPMQARDRVLVHAFDTNVNDIAKLSHLRRSVTQTSAPWTVGEYLERADPSVRDWFPHELRDLHRKNLTDGAGQVRCISRLAYRAAIDANRLDTLTQQFAKVMSAGVEREITSVRVMIVSSLAGGTGAGMFLQTALYVRELLEQAFGRQNVLIRGAFVLPDVFLNTGTLKDEKQIENTRANGYACLKELDAITRVATGVPAKETVTIELEYRPRQVDLQGRLDHAIGERHLPYDFCFLFDFENTAGENLGTFENYIEQITQVVYLQLFSPIAAGHFSQEDNQITRLVESQGTSRYCGAGVARLIYPYGDILDYCSLRWAAEALTEEWLKPDHDYAEELRAYERDIASGIVRQPPDRRERYMFFLESYASGQPPLPFFKQIHRSAHRIGEKGEIGIAKAQAFIDALTVEIERICNESADINALEAECQVDEVRLKERNHTTSEVDRIEESLARLEERVLRFVDETRTFLVSRAVLHDCDAPELSGSEDYRLNAWLLSKPEPLHPVAIRYVLYHVDRLIDSTVRGGGVNSFGETVRALQAENDQLLRKIKHYDKAYDIPDDEGIVESAQDRIRLALGQSMLARVFKTNQFSEFVDEYRERSSEQRARLTAFKKSRLTELVLTDIQRSVQSLIELWERYFANLRDVRNRLLTDSNTIAEKHDKAGDPTRLYVLAGQKDKILGWDGIRTKYVYSELPAQIYRQIYTGQFRRFCAGRRGEQAAPENQQRVEEMFRKDVVAWCRAQLAKEDNLDLDVVSAVKQQAERLGRSGSSDLGEAFLKLDTLARPWAPASTSQAPIEFWAMHPDPVARLNGEQKNELGQQLIEEAAFSRYEVIRYRAQYGMRAEDFPKFSRGGGIRSPGVYFKTYQERMRALNEAPERTISPHLDKRWHLPAYLPDLNLSVEREDRQRIERALVLGLIFKDLKQVSQDGRATWLFSSGQQTLLVKLSGKEIPGRLTALFEGLGHNPAIVGKIISAAEVRLQRDLEEVADDISKHAFYGGCITDPNILERVLNYAQGTTKDQEVVEQAGSLLSCLLDEIARYFQAFHGTERRHSANRAAIAFIEKLMDGSPAYQAAKTSEDVIFERWRARIDACLDTLKR